MRLAYIACGFLTLFLGAYMDNTRGPLLPVFAQTLHLDYSQVSLFLVLGYAAAICGTSSLGFLVPRYGLRKIALRLFTLCLVPLLFPFFVSGQTSLYLFAMLLGMAVSATGATCNLFVIEGTDETRRARALCGLHMIYGFGSLVGPLAVSLLLSQNVSWKFVYPLLIPALLVTIGLVYRHVEATPVAPPSREPKRVTSLQVLIVLIYGVYSAGEVLTSMWMVTYLVETQHLSVAEASPYLSGFFLVLGMTRGLFLLIALKKFEGAVILGSLFLGAAGLVGGHYGMSWALPLAGLCGPFFPLVLARISRVYPKQIAGMTIWILAGTQVILGLSHLTVGRLVDKIGIEQAYWLPPFFLVLTAGLLGVYLVKEPVAK